MHQLYMIKLSEILSDVTIEDIIGEKDREIEHFRTGSNEVEEGDLFIAIKGALADGHDYIPDALEKGAKAWSAKSFRIKPMKTSPTFK